MDNYVALDIENPNTKQNSICSIGLIIVQANEVVDRKYSLINPECGFDRKNTEINSINAYLVRDSPTWPAFWDEICDVVSSYPIVGHNVIYDLRVISKSLKRYDMYVPEFSYICTKELSKRYLKDEPSYTLNSLAGKIGYTFKHHHALEDAEAANELFVYLKETYGLQGILPAKFRYEHKLSKKTDEKLVSNINDLHGIIESIAADDVVDEMEIGLLHKWMDENADNRIFEAFDRIITDLEYILQDGIITDYERTSLLTIVEGIEHSAVYSETTLGIQILRGILKGIVANEKITQKEIEALQIWLADNEYLAGVHQYDVIFGLVTKALNDGRITTEEENDLMQAFDAILNPVDNDHDFNVKGKCFCFTGEFGKISKDEIRCELQGRGGIEKSSVSSKVNYVIVGSKGSEKWKYGNIGGKIEKAQELQRKGINIQIIKEDDLLVHLRRA